MAIYTYSTSSAVLRYALNYKELNYKTQWVEYPDIESVCKRYGAPPTSNTPGQPQYTLPMIYDPATETVVVESSNIARYLDATYPETPQLFPAETRTLQAVFVDTAWPNLGVPLYMNVIHHTWSSLTPRSKVYFRETREDMFGKRLEDLGGEEDWESLKEALGKLDEWMKWNGDAPFLTGNRIVFCDILIAGLLTWAKVVCGPESDGWKRIASWHDGRWARMEQLFEKYAHVDHDT